MWHWLEVLLRVAANNIVCRAIKDFFAALLRLAADNMGPLLLYAIFLIFILFVLFAVWWLYTLVWLGQVLVGLLFMLFGGQGF
jgi:hypothetical protein